MHSVHFLAFGWLLVSFSSRGEEARLEARVKEEAGGLLYLHAETDLGRSYQVEWSPSLQSAAWVSALSEPVEGTGGPQAFYLGQWPNADGPPPHHPARRDFAIVAYADGTALAQWMAPDGSSIQRRLSLDFRRVPRQAQAVAEAATVVTRTQLSDAPPASPLSEAEDPDPEIRAALQALADAYPLLQLSPPLSVVRTRAESGALTGTRFWRLRRIEQDSDLDGVTDHEEWNRLQTNPHAADSDGDGASDSAEVSAGTPPLDFFNGRRATLAILPSRWGDVPLAAPNEWLGEPVVVEVRGPDGTPLPFAPVTAAATSGGLDEWEQPLAARVAKPVVAARADAAGRVTLAWRSEDVPSSATLIHFWTGHGAAYQGAHGLVHTGHSPPPLNPSVLAWLKAEAGVATASDGRVESWSDPARSVIAAASGDLRPRLSTAGPLPMLEFDGTHRLDFGSALGGASLSALFVAHPSAARTQPAVSAADPANRTPGLSGQRYLLAGEVTAASNPWLYTPPVARKLETTQFFSRYSALFMLSYTSPTISFKGYECRPLSYASGFLLPGLPASQAPAVRYDITSNAIPDPGPPQRQNGKIYRLNPTLPNCPLKAGASLASCLSDFVTRRALPASYEWETRQLATYTRRAGNPLTDDFSEIYYEAKGYSPEVPEKFQLQPASIGSVGQGISAGSNSSGYFQLSQAFAPALGSAPASPGPSLTSVVITNGRPSFYLNGSPAGTSVAPAGGSVTGVRHIGALANATNGFVGAVGDIILTSGSLTDDARRTLEDTLAERRRLNQIDRDADTLPDWWERRCLTAGTASTAVGNTDGDSLTNAQERARFTLPELADSDRDGLTDGAESATAAIKPDLDSDGFLDGVDATPADPANGQADADADGTPDGLASLLAAAHPRDSDGDSLSDLAESVTARTNPLASDTDGDSLPDGWEQAHHLDPNDPGGAEGREGDPDSDGKSNTEERALGTHPRVPD